MNDVKIVRLKNGNDVIGFVTEKLDGSLFIMEPMEITIHTEGRYSGLILKNCLKTQFLISGLQLRISKKEFSTANSDMSSNLFKYDFNPEHIWAHSLAWWSARLISTR